MKVRCKLINLKIIIRIKIKSIYAFEQGQKFIFMYIP